MQLSDEKHEARLYQLTNRTWKLRRGEITVGLKDVKFSEEVTPEPANTWPTPPDHFPEFFFRTLRISGKLEIQQNISIFLSNFDCIPVINEFNMDMYIQPEGHAKKYRRNSKVWASSHTLESYPQPVSETPNSYDGYITLLCSAHIWQDLYFEWRRNCKNILSFTVKLTLNYFEPIDAPEHLYRRLIFLNDKTEQAGIQINSINVVFS